MFRSYNSVGTSMSDLQVGFKKPIIARTGIFFSICFRGWDLVKDVYYGFKLVFLSEILGVD